MRQVTLYSATKQQVISYDLKSLHQFKYPPIQDLIPVYGSDQVLAKSTVEKISSPIELYRWSNGREILAAFDEELRELIGISQDKFERDVKTATDRRVKHQYAQLLAVKDDHQGLIELSPWRSMVWAIKKIWR